MTILDISAVLCRLAMQEERPRLSHSHSERIRMDNRGELGIPNPAYITYKMTDNLAAFPTNTPAYKHSFTTGCISTWNLLPELVAGAPLLGQLKPSQALVSVEYDKVY